MNAFLTALCAGLLATAQVSTDTPADDGAHFELVAEEPAELVPLAPASPRARPRPPGKRAPLVATELYLVPTAAEGELPCEQACLKATAARARNRPGVTKVEIKDSALRLQVDAKRFSTTALLAGLEGVRLEMRLPYQAIEVRFAAAPAWPPLMKMDGSTLVLELGANVKESLEAATRFTLSSRMRCVGALSGLEANEAVLVRAETERRLPSAMAPFVTQGDFDGDKREDLYLRLEELPEVVIFNRREGLQALAVTSARGEIEAIPRCSQSPTRYVRTVAKSKVQCAGLARSPNVGDAIERVEHNRSAELLMWTGEKFFNCEPLGEGSKPPPEEKKKQE